jgi:hypothetical protein
MSPGRAQRVKRTEEHTITYMPRSGYREAAELTADYISKAQASDISGTQIEYLMADLFGGTKRADTPLMIPDLDAGGIPYSVKSRKLKFAQCRPVWENWLGQSEVVPVTSIFPEGPFRGGKSYHEVGDQALGNYVLGEYNNRLQLYGHERILLVYRVLFPEQPNIPEHWRYFVWWEHLEPLDPKQIRWRASSGSSGGRRNLAGHHRDQLQRGKDPGAAALSWTEQHNEFWIRYTIPEDADTFIVWTEDDNLLTRAEVDAAIREGRIKKQRGRR